MKSYSKKSACALVMLLGGVHGMVQATESLVDRLVEAIKAGYTTQGYNKAVALMDNPQLDINAKGWLGRTPLMEAALFGRHKIAAQLRMRGASPNIADERRGYTALMYAAELGYIEVVKELFNYGSRLDTRIRSKRGKTALDIAREQVPLLAKDPFTPPKLMASQLGLIKLLESRAYVQNRCR